MTKMVPAVPVTAVVAATALTEPLVAAVVFVLNVCTVPSLLLTVTAVVDCGAAAMFVATTLLAPTDSDAITLTDLVDVEAVDELEEVEIVVEGFEVVVEDFDVEVVVEDRAATGERDVEMMVATPRMYENETMIAKTSKDHW